MGKPQILDKLEKIFKSPSISEVDVVYILSRIRKMIEMDGAKKNNKVLLFYCNLALHDKINDVPKEILKKLNETKDGIDYSDLFTLNIFHEKLKEFLIKNDFSFPYAEKHKREFEELLLDIYSDTPIILENKYKITFTKTTKNGDVIHGISGSPYISKPVIPKIILASGPVIIENNKVLLVKHGDNFWKFCGGKAKNFENESLKEIAIREAKEETNLDITIVDEQPFFFFTKKESTEGIIDVVLVHFSAEGKGEIKLGKDIEACEWFDINNLPPDIAPNIKPAIEYFAK